MTSPSAAGPARELELRAGLSAVRERIAAACRLAGRPGDDVTLVVVTKTYPAADVLSLAGLGVRDVGENRDQEASEKAACLSALPLVWHFVGRLQTNKARSVATYAASVHSVDRPEIVDALARAMPDGRRPDDALAAVADRPLDCLLQVSLDGDPRRGGVVADGLESLAERVAGTPGLRLAGIMAVAPLGVDPQRAFAVLASLSERVRRVDAGAGWISAGMSSDLEAAVGAGATHLRVGSAVLGPRRVLG